MTLNLKSATSVTLESRCILPVLAASEATAASEAMAASEVRYDLIFEISNLSYPVICILPLLVASEALEVIGGLRGQSTFRISEVN